MTCGNDRAQGFLRELEAHLGCPCRLSPARPPWHAACDGLVRSGMAGLAQQKAAGLKLPQIERAEAENGYLNLRFAPGFLSSVLMEAVARPCEGENFALRASANALSCRPRPASPPALARPDRAAELFLLLRCSALPPSRKESIRRQLIVRSAEGLRAPMTEEEWLYLAVLRELYARFADGVDNAAPRDIQ